MRTSPSWMFAALMWFIPLVAHPYDAPQPPFHLDLIPELRKKWEGDPRLLRWAAFEEFEWKTEGRAPYQEFRTGLGLAPDMPWVLTDAKGLLVTNGMEELDLDRIQRTLEARGWKSKESNRLAFLEANPNQVEARREEVLCHLAYLTLLSIRRKGQPQELAESAWSEAVTGLEVAFSKLVQIEGWTDYLTSTFRIPWRTLSLFEDQPFHPAFQPVVARALNDLETAIQREPSRRELWALWALFSNLASVGKPPLEILTSLDPIPGVPFPPSSTAPQSYYVMRRDWRGLLDYGRWGWMLSGTSDLTKLLPDNGPGKSTQDRAGFPNKETQGASPSEAELARKSRVLCWGEAISLALIQLERSEDLFSWFTELRSESGAAWVPSAESNLKLMATLKPSLLSNELRNLLVSAPLPYPRPIRLGNPAMRLAWSPETGLINFREEPAFDPWGPEELEFRGLSRLEWNSLQHRNGWGSEGRWILLRGSEVMVSDRFFSQKPESIAQHLRGLSPPRLELLGAYIRTHPDSLDARKARLSLLVPRMPHPRLVSLLLDDAAATLTTPVAEGMQGVDYGASQKTEKEVLNRLEERLSAFPSEESLWNAYVGWSRLLGQGDKWLTRLAGSIQVLGDRARWAQGLPDNVSFTIGEAYAKQHDWGGLDAWCSLLNEKGKRLSIRLQSLRYAEHPR